MVAGCSHQCLWPLKNCIMMSNWGKHHTKVTHTRSSSTKGLSRSTEAGASEYMREMKYGRKVFLMWLMAVARIGFYICSHHFMYYFSKHSVFINKLFSFFRTHRQACVIFMSMKTVGGEHDIKYIPGIILYCFYGPNKQAF